ncbi:MAG: hypothetical protein NTW86_01635 [Candidatus Sumerlaeota bacterium]|nr:hypothetical protein [Candidatus Sumerlaeota bacterium]
MNAKRWRERGMGFVSSMLFWGIAAAAFGQQVPDSTYDTRVAEPAFKETHPRVAIDEAHFNVHTAEGGYKAFADLIANDGCEVTSNTAKFSAESLKANDILVIANARGAAMRNDPNVDKPAFTDAECDAVRDWVQAGGALLFIADHYPIGSASECLAKRFGVDMSKGHTSDPEHVEPSRPSLSCLAFTRENGLLGDHPITRGRNEKERIQHFATFTGQSLKGPEGSVALLKLADTAYDEVPPNNERVSAAGRAQGVAFTFGKGRVVVMGEAACLTAQTTGGARMGGGAAGPRAGMNRPATGGAASQPAAQPAGGRPMAMGAASQPASQPGGANRMPMRGRAKAGGGMRMPMGPASQPMGGASRPMGATRRMGKAPASQPAVSQPSGSNPATTGANALGAMGANAGAAMGMNAPGLDNRQMALNIIHWLARLLN